MNNTTSSVLFMLCNNDCRSIRPNRYFIKFSDDTALLILLSNDEVGHGTVLNDFVAYCDRSYLCLNVALFTLIAPYCPCFINLVSRVF